MRREHIKGKGKKLKKCGSLSGGKNFRTKSMTTSKFISRPDFILKVSFNRLLFRKKDGSILGCVQIWLLVLPDELISGFANFLQFFKNAEARRNYIGDCSINYATENDKPKYLRRLLISSFKLKK